MKGPYEFRPNWEMDRNFSEAIKLACKSGVKVMAYDSIVTENSIFLDKKIRINL